jgi:hypothetical protein
MMARLQSLSFIPLRTILKMACRASYSLTAPRSGRAGYTVKGQRFGLQIGALERFNMKMQRFIGHQPALLIHFQRNGGDLQQGVGFGIKSCGFNINHHRIKTAKTVAQTIKLSVLGHQILLAGKSSAHYGKFCRGLQQAG